MFCHNFKAYLTLAALIALVFAGSSQTVSGAPVKNIVLVHGAWTMDRVGERLTIFSREMAIETSFEDDVAATERVIDLQDGPCILVGHSYGGSIISQAGTDPHVVGLVYIAAHAPDIGENESALGKRMPSLLAGPNGAIEKTKDGFTYLNPMMFADLFAPDLPPEEAEQPGQSH